MTLLVPGTSSVLNAKISPVVIYSICDSYIRRNEGQDRVIGILLGSTDNNGTCHIRNCFTVIHSEQDGEVAVDVLHQKTLLTLHQRVSPRDHVVGWFSSGAQVRAIDIILQNFYREECANPVHLTLDTDLLGSDASIVKTYISRQVGLGDRPLATEFVEIANEVLMDEAKVIGFDPIASVKSEGLPTDAQSLQRSMDRLVRLLDTMMRYVDEICAGKRKGDPQVGRLLADVVSAASSALNREEVERVLQESQQDAALVLYLAKLVQTQMVIADKLGTSTLPIM